MMKSKWELISSIVFIVIEILAIISFIVLAFNGEYLKRWIFTVLLAVMFVILGIRRIIDYKKQRKVKNLL